MVNPVGHSIYGSSDYEVWLELLRRCYNNGYDNGNTRSLFNVSYSFQYNRVPMVVASEIYNACTAYTTHYAEVLLQKLPGYRESGDAEYDYSERIRDSLDLIVDKLRNKRNSKSAVINVANQSDFALENPPCMTEVQFRILGASTLLTMFTFRSHDLYKGFLPNMQGIALASRVLAQKLWGTDTTINYLYSGTSKDLHIYHDDLDTVSKLRKPQFMQLPYVTPDGSLYEALPDTVDANVSFNNIDAFYPQATPTHAEYLKNV